MPSNNGWQCLLRIQRHSFSDSWQDERYWRWSFDFRNLNTKNLSHFLRNEYFCLWLIYFNINKSICISHCTTQCKFLSKIFTILRHFRLGNFYIETLFNKAIKVWNKEHSKRLRHGSLIFNVIRFINWVQ